MTPDAHDDLFAAIEAEIDGQRGPASRLRELRTPVRTAVVAFLALAIPAVVALTWLRSDYPVYPKLRFAIELGALALPALFALWLAVRPLHRPALPRWAGPAVVVTGLLVAAVIAVTPEAHLVHPSSLRGTGEEFLRLAVGCLTVGLILGVPVALLTWAVARGPRVPAVAFVLGGLVGMLGLQLHCPIVSPKHLLAGHFPVLAVLLLAAVALRALRRR